MRKRRIWDAIWGEPRWCAFGASLKLGLPGADNPSGHFRVQVGLANVLGRT
jgi:hypothetical protein